MLAFWLVPCYAKVMAAKVHQFQKTPSGFRVADVTIRLARPDERARWDAIMDQRHYLGFKRFAGRGLRYVFEWHGHWLGLAGWQSGAFKCGPRDRWVGWKRGIQFARLHLISNNTRFLILGEPGCFPNLASFALAGMTRRLSADWYAAWGHELLLAETFVDPSRFCGHMYAAAGWTRLGRTKGFARASGKYTDPHGVPKDLHVFPLRRDARRRMREPCDLADGLQPSPMGRMSALPSGCLRSLYDELLRVPDFRRAQGRKHTIASVLAIFIAARLAGITSGIGAAQYARALNQTELQALGAWRNKKTGRFEPPSKSVLYRVLEMADPAEIEAVLKRFSAPRLSIGAAIASDGKRIRGANRNGEGHHETATLVEHETGLPVASHGFHDESGEIAAVQALLEDVSVAGRVITVDALHTVRDTARSIVETHKADYLMTVKANAPETFATLETINWERDATGSYEEEYTKAHGRIELRRILTMTPLRGTVNYPHLTQIFRIERQREICKSGTKSIEITYGITSVPECRGAPEKLLAWNRGHWSVENRNHRARDVNFGEDACLSRTAHAPVNCALCNCIALAIILSRCSTVAETRRHFALHRSDAIQAVLSPV